MFILKTMIDFERITTRGGDSGQTSIADGSRRAKDDLIIEVLGEVDELHAALGLFRASLEETSRIDEVEWIQQCMIRIGGMISVPPSHPGYGRVHRLGDEDVEKLEGWQKEMMDQVDLPPIFITYGTTECGARADLARAVCRRTERRIVSLIREQVMKDLAPAQRFINRLSDYLFIFARFLDARDS